MMRRSVLKSEQGTAMVIVIAVGLILAILGFSLLKLAEFEVSLGHRDIRKMKAFYFAESGIARYITNAYHQNYNDITETPFEEGSYRVEVYPNPTTPDYVVATGRAGREYKSIKVGLAFLAYPFEQAIFGGNYAGADYTLDLRGAGDPQYSGRGTGPIYRGGRDEVHGNVYVNGDVALYQGSSVNPAIAPNTYGLNGDVEATGGITVNDSALISGGQYPGASVSPLPDLLAMNYAVNNSHNVSQLFTDAGISSGRLPRSSPLYNAVVKNPSDRPQEVASTAGDDYFLEPARITNPGSWNTASTPLRLTDGAVYYVDGNVWIHNISTFGFQVNGKVTVVATGDIHISDNVDYANPQSSLGLIALGEYDGAGDLVSGGNIYFGDPRFGTMYFVDALMFAANNFFYSTDSVTGRPGEPETGFSVYGNFAGMNQVSINRDWYTPDGSRYARPAYYDNTTGVWLDIENRTPLTQTELNRLRHYKMKIEYDERIQDPRYQPPGMPRGPGTIFNGIRYWEEVLPVIS